jgi:transglutaminase-like putative cysteine protease
MAYEPSVADSLDPFRRWSHVVLLRTLADSLVAQAGNDAQTFVSQLATYVHKTCRQIVREDGEPLAPKDTLARGEGSCRDLTVLYMDMARAAGFAARFVSGYLAGGNEHELHAWAEVYLPGGGWRGFDPSLGLATADRHIAVASAATPRGAAPVTGSYRGETTPPVPATEVIITELP